jgi:membrane protein YqaA with SNARE-associated domain
VKGFIKRLRKYAGKPWFLPLVCFLAAIDLFIVILPTEAMIMTTTLMRPRRWFLNAFSVTTASALGAIALSITSRAYGEPFVAWIAGPQFLHSAKWLRTEAWIETYGFWAVFLSALGPLPQQPVILVAAVLHMTLPAIFFAAWLGRIPKYSFFSYLASRGEKWIREEVAAHPFFNKFPRIRNFLLKIVHEAEPQSGDQAAEPQSGDRA